MKLKDFLTPGGWDHEVSKYKYLDPLGYASTKKLNALEDRGLAQLWEGVGAQGMSREHNDDAQKFSRGLGHRGLALLAYGAGSAMGGGGAGGAGGGGGSGWSNYPMPGMQPQQAQQTQPEQLDMPPGVLLREQLEQRRQNEALLAALLQQQGNQR